MSYPATFESDFVEERSRLTTFFRGIMVIPHILWLYIYGTLASLAVIAAWFALVFTAQYPKGLYDFVAGYTRWLMQVSGYMLLLTDNYPPFWGNVEDDYPVRMRFAGPLQKYSRAKAFFRPILAIPILILRYVISLLLYIGAIAAWFVIVITGRQPKGLQEVLELGVSYTGRSDAYLYLLTETYPPFQDDAGALAASQTGPGLADGGGVTPAPAQQVRPLGSPEDPTA